VYAGLLIGRAPFWLATALFVACFVWQFTPDDATQRRRLTVALIAGVLTSAVVTLVFQYVFLVRLP
jgi:putative tricarboxylic transport membrane protein